MNYSTPEKHGISSARIKKYIELLEGNRLSTHSVIIVRGNDILYEKYWEPFNESYLHRMYSVSKSFVALAVGFAEQDGLLSLDDPMIKHFPDELKNQEDENLKNQTVRHMLMMCTAKGDVGAPEHDTPDRVRYYFENKSQTSRPSGKLYEYDSTGSFVLGALVERLTGMELMDYLRVKLFDKIGVSKEAYCLKAAGGHSWGDSGVLCTSKDLLLVARFCLNKGKWNGEQILNERYMTNAISKQIDNNIINTVCNGTFGYGYLIWRTYDNSFFLNGMGCQFAVCVPDKDIILIYNGDNQGMPDAKEIIIGKFFELIVRPALDEPLEDDLDTFNELKRDNKQLYFVSENVINNIQDKINGKEYIANPNPMGIKKFSLCFDGDEGTFHYNNAQGKKELKFGIGKNFFSEFPQDGYGDTITMVPREGYRYKCASSAGWIEENILYISVQIIDKYFGRLHIRFGFADEDNVGIHMTKTAEYFLDEYNGYLTGRSKG